MAGQACSHDTPHKLPATELPGTSWPAIGDQAGFEPFSGETTRAALTPPDWITITHSRSVDHDVARQPEERQHGKISPHSFGAASATISFVARSA